MGIKRKKKRAREAARQKKTGIFFYLDIHMDSPAAINPLVEPATTPGMLFYLLLYFMLLIF
jgi:hypothetical protein